MVLHRQGKSKPKDIKEMVSNHTNTVNDVNKVSGEAKDCDQSKVEQEDITMVMQSEASKGDTINSRIKPEGRKFKPEKANRETKKTLLLTCIKN